MNNVGYTPGAGATIAADEIDGVLHQRVKLGIGEEGIAEDLSKENPMPVEAVRLQDLLAMMNRLVKVCESLMMVDSAQRQRVTIDAITGNLVLTTVSNITTVNTVTTVGGQTTLAGMNNEMYINPARQTYAQGIRANLNFQ
jgi:hypothetical protein